MDVLFCMRLLIEFIMQEIFILSAIQGATALDLFMSESFILKIIMFETTKSNIIIEHGRDFVMSL